MSELSVDRGGAGVGSPATMKEFHAERRPRNKGSAAPPARASTQRSGVALHGYEQSAPRFCLHEPSSVAHPRAESRIHLEAWLCVARSETSFSPEAGHWSDRHRRGPARSRQSAPVLAFRSDASARVLVRAAPAADDEQERRTTLLVPDRTGSLGRGGATRGSLLPPTTSGGGFGGQRVAWKKARSTTGGTIAAASAARRCHTGSWRRIEYVAPVGRMAAPGTPLSSRVRSEGSGC
jgi:hypothetical protein